MGEACHGMAGRRWRPGDARNAATGISNDHAAWRTKKHNKKQPPENTPKIHPDYGIRSFLFLPT